MAVPWNLLAQPMPEAVQFNPLAAIQAHRQGVADYRTDRKDNALIAAGQRMQAGDSKGAQAALYGAGEFDAGFKIQEHQFKQAQHELEVLTRAGRAADLADTPEKWAQVHRTLGLPAQYADFKTGRETARMMAYDKAALLQQSLIRAQTEMAQAHSELFRAQAQTSKQKEDPYTAELLKQRAKHDEEWRTGRLDSADAADELARQAADLAGIIRKTPGAFGPVSGSVAGQVFDKIPLNPFGSQQRDEARGMAESRIALLEALLAKAHLKGQGSVTDAERAMIARMVASVRQNPDTAQAVMADVARIAQAAAQRARADIKTGRTDRPIEPTAPAPAADAKPAAQPTAQRRRARNPQTGQVVEYDGEKWVEVK